MLTLSVYRMDFIFYFFRLTLVFISISISVRMHKTETQRSRVHHLVSQVGKAHQRRETYMLNMTHPMLILQESQYRTSQSMRSTVSKSVRADLNNRRKEKDSETQQGTECRMNASEPPAQPYCLGDSQISVPLERHVGSVNHLTYDGEGSECVLEVAIPILARHHFRIDQFLCNVTFSLLRCMTISLAAIDLYVRFFRMNIDVNALDIDTAALLLFLGQHDVVCTCLEWFAKDYLKNPLFQP